VIEKEKKHLKHRHEKDASNEKKRSVKFQLPEEGEEEVIYV
jgi:DNA-directed RNA polymerase subunit M/transcription elongation factor TFIIS